MMSNSSIIYHSESVLEMQFLCLITFQFLIKFPFQEITDNPHAEDIFDSKLIMYALIGEHVFAYISGIFRTWEIKKYGKVDLNGIFRARRESFLSTVEIFLDCLIFGFSINHMVSLTPEEFNLHPYTHIWIILDCLLMFLTLAYVYLT